MSQQAPVVRTARAEDVDALAAVHVEAWRAAYRGLLPQHFLDSADLDMRRTEWARWVEDGRYEGATVDVGLVGDVVAGFAIHGPRSRGEAHAAQPPCGELHSLNVHPDHWGVGLGRALIARAREALAAAGMREAVLWALPTNARALRFYERDGWRADGGARSYLDRGVPIDEVRYRRALP